MYTDKVMDHFSNPRNVGELEEANGVGEVGNASCGDIMKIFLKVEDNIIQDVKFKTFGCGAAIATSSMVTEMAIGKTIDEALVLTNEAVAEALDGLPPAAPSSIVQPPLSLTKTIRVFSVMPSSSNRLTNRPTL